MSADRYFQPSPALPDKITMLKYMSRVNPSLFFLVAPQHEKFLFTDDDRKKVAGRYLSDVWFAQKGKFQNFRSGPHLIQNGSFLF